MIYFIESRVGRIIIFASSKEELIEQLSDMRLADVVDICIAQDNGDYESVYDDFKEYIGMGK